MIVLLTMPTVPTYLTIDSDHCEGS